MTKLLDLRKKRIDLRNRRRLTNLTPTLISSNCTAGMIYHYLGLEFRSPFINLWMTNEDFLTAMENFDEFIATPLTEDRSGIRNYPVGIGFGGARVFFLHYSSWEEAIGKWNERIGRIDRENMGVMLSNFNAKGIEVDNPQEILERFDRLPFRHKVVFTRRNHPDIKSAVPLPGWRPDKGENAFDTRPLLRNRYIDSFDYVDFINSLKET